VGLFWPSQGDSGVHVNISGAGVVKHSKRPEAATALLEWLSSEKAQSKFASLNLEYPVKAGVELDPIVKGWGEFKESRISVEQFGALQAESVKLMDRAGYK
jgi:iron(III) transport system substrate-binding protein